MVIDGVSLQVHAGEKVGLVGPNGAGKTTLLKIILKMEEPGIEEGGRIHGQFGRCSTVKKWIYLIGGKSV